MDDEAQAVLAAAAAIEGDEDTEERPTAEAIAARTGPPADVVAGALHWLFDERLLWPLEVVGGFTSVGMSRVNKGVYRVTDAGRVRLAE